MMGLWQSKYTCDEVRLRYSVGSNQGNFQDEKTPTTPCMDQCLCVLCWEAERTCQIKGDSGVLLEHNCWIQAKGRLINDNQKPGKFKNLLLRQWCNWCKCNLAV